MKGKYLAGILTLAGAAVGGAAAVWYFMNRKKDTFVFRASCSGDEGLSCPENEPETEECTDSKDEVAETSDAPQEKKPDSVEAAAEEPAADNEA